MYRKNLHSIFGPTPEVDCDCTRSCHVIQFDPIVQRYHSTNEKSSSSVYLLDNHTILKERLTYDLISLFGDFGGNLGLWLGLSSLSLLNLVFVIANWNLKKPRNHRNYTIRIIPIYLKCNQTMLKRQRIKSDKNCLDRIFFLIYICLFGCTGFIVQQKFQLFLSEPIQNTVLIEDPANITHPNIIICAGPHNPRLIWQKEKFLKEKKQNNTKCNVDMLDLVNWKGLTVDKLWNLTYVEPINYELIQAFAFITPVEEPNFSYNFNSALPSSMQTSTILVRLNTQYLNTKKKHCNNNVTDYYVCKSQCFDNKMKSKQLCSMPFAMKKDIAFCTSSATAKAVRNLYYEIQTNTNVEKNVSASRLVI
uniref:Uncharacterized protein n=1 Tax=Strigamia maritima TaxID=126957 RepID=T1ILX1_STRMM